MNVGVTPDANGHYVVEAYLPDRDHAGYSKYQPLRKFIVQGDARLFADMIREHKLPTPADIYARTYDAKRVISCMTRTNDCTSFKFKMITI